MTETQKPKTAAELMADLLKDAVWSERLAAAALPHRDAYKAAVTMADSEAIYAPFHRWLDGFLFRATTVHALRKLQELDPSAADEVAEQIEAHWDAGDVYPELLWEWATESGIDPETYIAEQQADRERWLAEPTNHELERRAAADNQGVQR